MINVLYYRMKPIQLEENENMVKENHFNTMHDSIPMQGFEVDLMKRQMIEKTNKNLKG